MMMKPIVILHSTVTLVKHSRSRCRGDYKITRRPCIHAILASLKSEMSLILILHRAGFREVTSSEISSSRYALESLQRL